MTNIRRLAEAIYDTGDSKRIMCAFRSLLEIGLEQGDYMKKEVQLISGQIPVGAINETELHENAS